VNFKRYFLNPVRYGKLRVYTVKFTGSASVR
jgi:hypothetical protein